MKKFVIVIPSILFFVTSTLGCECLSGGITEKERSEYYLSQADSVISAKVIGFEYRKGVPLAKLQSIDPDVKYEMRMVVLEVIDWRKKEVPAILVMNTLRARNADGNETFGGCDYGFNEGETYLIFAKQHNGYYETNKCSGSRILNAANPILEFLGPADKPKSDETLVFFSGLRSDFFS